VRGATTKGGSYIMVKKREEGKRGKINRMVFGCRGVEQELGESVRLVEGKPGIILSGILLRLGLGNS